MKIFFGLKKHVLLCSLVAVWAITPLASADEMNVDSALKLLLEDVEIQRYLRERQVDQLKSGSYRVQVGDTLDQIIELTMSESGVKKSFIRQAFVQANPAAFRSGNPNWLIAGREIRVPTADDVLALIFVTPPKSINESTKNWVKYP